MILSVGREGDLFIFPDTGDILPKLTPFNIDPKDPWHYLPKMWDIPCVHRIYIRFGGKCQKRILFLWWCCYFEEQTCLSRCENCNERSIDQSRQGTTVSTIQLTLKASN